MPSILFIFGGKKQRFSRCHDPQPHRTLWPSALEAGWRSSSLEVGLNWMANNLCRTTKPTTGESRFSIRSNAWDDRRVAAPVRWWKWQLCRPRPVWVYRGLLGPRLGAPFSVRYDWTRGLGPLGPHTPPSEEVLPVQNHRSFPADSFRVSADSFRPGWLCPSKAGFGLMCESGSPARHLPI